MVTHRQQKEGRTPAEIIRPMAGLHPQSTYGESHFHERDQDGPIKITIQVKLKVYVSFVERFGLNIIWLFGFHGVPTPLVKQVNAAI